MIQVSSLGIRSDIYSNLVSEDAVKRLAGEFDLEAILVLDLSDKGRNSMRKLVSRSPVRQVSLPSSSHFRTDIIWVHPSVCSPSCSRSLLKPSLIPHSSVYANFTPTPRPLSQSDHFYRSDDWECKYILYVVRLEIETLWVDMCLECWQL